MFCANCGEKLDDGTKFCAKCGAKVEGSAVSAPAQPVYQQAPQQQINVTAAPYQQMAYQGQAARAPNPLEYFGMAWKKYAVFSGRSRCAEFWWFFLFNWIINIVLGLMVRRV